MLQSVWELSCGGIPMKKRRLTEDERHEANAKFMPTPEQIAAGCKEINEQWDEAEKARRRGARKSDGDRWNVPTVRESGSEGDE